MLLKKVLENANFDINLWPSFGLAQRMEPDGSSAKFIPFSPLNLVNIALWEEGVSKKA